MALAFYTFSIRFLQAGAWLASFFNAKLALFVKGRRGLLHSMRHDFKANKNRVVWVHCASLGEFEQGRPLIEAIKNELTDTKILLTFFSPSGYEVKKKYAHADWVYYLPWDLPRNAKEFVSITKPSLAIFIKYEFWLHYTNELKRQNIPVISVASIFRENQLFFKPYGIFYRDILKKFSQFFVQNQTSVELLKSVGITNAKLTGDTRFDRVYEIVKKQEEILLVKKFKNTDTLLVAGSVWQEDMEVLTPFINDNRAKQKFVLAPHEISDSFLQRMEAQLQQKYIRYSQCANVPDLEDYTILIMDNIGMLSKLYKYGEFAFVGGAFGKGLHNVLEAACYGIPIFFGNKNFRKFQEAVDLINCGGAFEVSDYSDFLAKYEMVTIPENFMLACEVTRAYVEENLGATEKIMTYCRKILKA
jgi:3-deoxy-D-manno-octulosonic-acid transferase